MCSTQVSELQLNQKLDAASKPAIETLMPFLNRMLGPKLHVLLGCDFSLSIAAPQGNLNYTYLVTPAGAKSPVAVLKVKSRSEFEHPITRRLSGAYEKEKAVLKLCTNAYLPVPAALGDVMRIDQRFERTGPFACLLQRFIDGKNGRQIAPLKTDAELGLLDQVGEFAKRIHQIQFKRFGDSVSTKGTFTKSWGAYLDHLFRFPLRTISGFLSADEYDVFTARFKELRGLKGPGVLVHADMHLANMLFDPAKHTLTGVIDWERSRSSRPSEEFARILYENFVLGQRFSVQTIGETIRGSGITPQFGRFISGYGMSPDDYETFFRRQTETLLMLFCAGFWARWELEYKEVRPDWQAPAQYSAKVVHGVLGKG
jgi:aminoglycoside phosphotransferase (APT) family kinase protein